MFPRGSNLNVLYDIYLPTECSGGRGVPDEPSETDPLVYGFTYKGGMYVYFSKITRLLLFSIGSACCLEFSGKFSIFLKTFKKRYGYMQ